MIIFTIWLKVLWRMLKADYGIDLSWLPTLQRLCLYLLGLVVRAEYVSHMLIAVVRRPAEQGRG